MKKPKPTSYDDLWMQWFGADDRGRRSCRKNAAAKVRTELEACIDVAGEEPVARALVWAAIDDMEGLRAAFCRVVSQ